MTCLDKGLAGRQTFGDGSRRIHRQLAAPCRVPAGRVRGATVREIYGARVTAAGGVLDPNGVIVATAAGGRFHPKIASAAAIDLVVYEDRRAGNSDIFATRLAGGVALTVLDPAGIALTTDASYQVTPTVTAVAAGFFVAWSDARALAATQHDIWAQLVSSAGVPIGTNFVTEVVDDGKGALFSKVVKVIPTVNQTLGYDPAVFAKIGLPSRTVPECKKY